MALDIRDSGLLDLIDSEAEVKQVATGCKFHGRTALELRWEVLTL